MNVTKALGMIGLAAGVVLVGFDSGAAPPAQGPLTPCAQAPKLADCGRPEYLKQCPGNKQACENINGAELDRFLKDTTKNHPNKLFVPGYSSTKGFVDTMKESHYGIGASPFFPTQPVAPVRSNPRAHHTVSPAIMGNTQNHWAAKEVRAAIDALSFVPFALGGRLQTFERRHTAAGAAVGSCDDFVYKAYYDDERWLDAIYGCKGDDRCKVNVSLQPQTPGIARRTLMSADTPPAPIGVATHEYSDRWEIRGNFPKNAFYAGTGAFLPDSLIDAFASDPAKKQSLQALYDVVRNQLSTYTVESGAKGNALGATAQGFKDEWDLHEVMNQRTATVTEGEFAEYTRRSEGVLEAMDNFWLVAKCAATLNPYACKEMPSAVGRVRPGEAQMWDGDPFVSRAVYGNVDRTNATNMAQFVQGRTGLSAALQAGAIVGQGLAFPGLGARSGVQSGAPLMQPMMAKMPGPGGTTANTIVSHQAMRLQQPQSPAVNNQALLYLQGQWKTHPPKIDTSVPYPRLACGQPKPGGSTARTKFSRPAAAQEAFVGEFAACQVVNAILDEWGKKQTGAGPTCYDATNYACDWSPQAFTKRWVNNFVNYQLPEKEKLYRSCTNWQLDLFKAGALPSVGRTKEAIRQKNIVRAQLLKNVPVKARDVFGEDRSNKETWGNSDFGVGYSYDLGWEAKIFKRYPAGAPGGLGGYPCNVGGRVHGAFDAFAYAFGASPFKIVDVNFGLDANDTAGQQTDPATLRAYGHAEFLESWEFFKIPNDPKNQSNGTVFTLNQPGALKPLYSSFDGGEQNIVTIPVQISWFTLVMSIGMAWNYGAAIFANAAAPGKDQCATDGKLFEVNGLVRPEANLDLVVGAEVDVLGGLAGAGVDVDVTLLGIQLPVRGGAAVTLSKAQSKDYADLSLDFDAGLDMVLHTLDGSLSVFIKGLFIKLAEFEILRWHGFHTTIPLFHVPTVKIKLAELGGAEISPIDGSTPPP